MEMIIAKFRLVVAAGEKGSGIKEEYTEFSTTL